MSRYAKTQEYRLKRLMENHPEIWVKEYYGSRVKNAGDFLVKVGDHQIRIDHKSTRNDHSIRIKKEWFSKLSEICLQRTDDEGPSIPVISISFLGHKGLYVFTTRVPRGTPLIKLFEIKDTGKSISIKSGKLYDLEGDVGLINFDGYPVYIMKFDTFIEEIKNA